MCDGKWIPRDSHFYWYLNGSRAFKYKFQAGDVYPTDLTQIYDIPLTGVTAQITDASVQGNGIIRVKSVMHVAAGSSIYTTIVVCTDRSVTSTPLTISIIRKLLISC